MHQCYSLKTVLILSTYHAYSKRKCAVICTLIYYFWLKINVGWNRSSILKIRDAKVMHYRGGSRGRVQGVRAPPPWDEAFLFVFAYKTCLPHQSATPFLSIPVVHPILRKILDPPLLRYLFPRSAKQPNITFPVEVKKALEGPYNCFLLEDFVPKLILKSYLVGWTRNFLLSGLNFGV